ncbi:MAG TPA: hypothetical protein VIC35_05845 [Acidimicrobiia bacterium]|jgi:hypothetical protein
MLLIACAVVVAVAAAVRSSWSPCGRSMLSSLTPLSERARGRSFRATACWYIAGSVLGGLTLGACIALAALVVGAWSISSKVILVAACAGALVAVASDTGIGGFHLPMHTRQVNEDWLDAYRGWVYGVGFGWQIGVGVGTFIMTAAVYLTVWLGTLTGSPLVALLLGGLFGLLRGLGILPARRCTTPERLSRLHERLDRYDGVARRAVVAVELGVAVLCGFAAALALGVAVAAAALVVGLVSARRAATRRGYASLVAGVERKRPLRSSLTAGTGLGSVKSTGSL